ncbi:MAG: hypothetical protein B7C24_16455 [Bacteroidetes bacterium 4572_77]|nr:MAG: hypothetical protein B7C24_16455 [Bacteroidetes bacterium 4572_77]
MKQFLFIALISLIIWSANGQSIDKYTLGSPLEECQDTIQIHVAGFSGILQVFTLDDGRIYMISFTPNKSLFNYQLNSIVNYVDRRNQVVLMEGFNEVGEIARYYSDEGDIVIWVDYNECREKPYQIEIGMIDRELLALYEEEQSRQESNL